jgi:hypothetical protein
VSWKQRLEKAGATPGKLALIGVLSLVLVGVILLQLPSTVETTAGTTSIESPQQQTNSTETDTPTASNENKQPEIRPWPKSDLAKTLANNPFPAN